MVHLSVAGKQRTPHNAMLSFVQQKQEKREFMMNTSISRRQFLKASGLAAAGACAAGLLTGCGGSSSGSASGADWPTKSINIVVPWSAGGDNDFQVSDEDINIGISMKKGNTELKEAIDSVLTKMTKDDFSAMMDEAISVQPLAN